MRIRVYKIKYAANVYEIEAPSYAGALVKLREMIGAENWDFGAAEWLND